MPKEYIIDKPIASWGISVSVVKQMLDDAGGDDVIFKMSTPGGSVYEGLAVSRLIKEYSGKTTGHVIGLAASMATYMLIAMDEVVVEDDSVFMIHNPYGLSIGDYRESEKFTNQLKALTSFIARRYSEKTGKPDKDMREAMDDETYYYGEDILKAGFADRMNKSERKKDKESALAIASVEIQACLQELKKNPESPDNISQIAAMLQIDATTTPTRQGAQTKPTQELKTMSLEKFLNEHPEFKAEVQAALDEKTQAVRAETKKESDAKVTHITNVLESDAYDAKVKKAAIKALKGEVTVEAFDMFLSVYDMNKEEKASEEAKNEQKKDTPASAQAELSTDGMIRTPADEAAYLAQFKKGKK